ncbi:uncharacterized protein B0T23DRAFT_192332 [Neurospora hispaniola]|uniref:Uncharacterized protein n=1 Tax=Neurospora hispaniola TaxID=588809 RepID=A0AAJ0I3I6_9PEZI|nr:hypothetical protein B0T23DRAFT_192332 [Neurospora hispaniola]
MTTVQWVEISITRSLTKSCRSSRAFISLIPFTDPDMINHFHGTMCMAFTVLKTSRPLLFLALLCLARSRSRLLHLSRSVSPSARRLRSTTPRENIRRIIRFSNRNSSLLMVLRLPFHCFPLKHYYAHHQKRNHLHQVNLEAEAQGNPFKFSGRKRGRAKSSSPPSQGLAILFSFHPTSRIPPSSPNNAVIEQRCGVSSCISAEHRMPTNADMLAVNS